MDAIDDRTYNATVATIAELLQRRIQEDAITQTALALKLGVSQPTVTRWLKGDNPPGPEHVGRIAEYLGLTIDDVVRAIHRQRVEGAGASINDRLTALELAVDQLRAMVRVLVEGPPPAKRRGRS